MGGEDTDGGGGGEKSHSQGHGEEILLCSRESIFDIKADPFFQRDQALRCATGSVTPLGSWVSCVASPIPQTSQNHDHVPAPFSQSLATISQSKSLLCHSWPLEKLLGNHLSFFLV